VDKSVSPVFMIPEALAHNSAKTCLEGLVLTMPDDRAHASAMACFDGFVRGRQTGLSIVAVLMVANCALLCAFGKGGKWMW